MPSIAKSNKWFVRIDGNHDYLATKAKELLGAIDTIKMLCLSHVGEKDENPHIHFTIETNVILQKQSYAVRIKNLFGVSTNKEYCIKVWDGSDACHSYMFHEPDEKVIVNKGYTPEDLKRFSSMNQEVQKIIAVNKKKGGGQCQVMVDFYKENDQTPSKKDIFSDLLWKVKHGEMYEPGDFQLKKYVEEIFLKTRATKEDVEQYIDDRFHELFRVRY